MEPATIGWLGGAAGLLVGLLGAGVGVVIALRKTNTGPLGRFVVQMGFVMAAMLLAFLGALFAMLAGVMPQWLFWTIAAVFFTANGPLIVFFIRRCRTLEAEA